jgi:hypothetical protein
MALLINQIRFYHYISGVLIHQQADPLCGRCKAYINTTLALREGLECFSTGQDNEINSLPAEIVQLFAEARKGIASVHLPERAEGQKKAGKCKMPQGVCFIKLSKAILEKS